MERRGGVVSGMSRLFLLLSSLLLTPLLGAAETAPRLNIISIVTDDQAAWTVGCYGNRESITPNMDRLAKEGVRFENAFTVW